MKAYTEIGGTHPLVLDLGTIRDWGMGERRYRVELIDLDSG